MRTAWLSGLAIALSSMVLAATAAPSVASTFFAWEVADVTAGDLLNIRAYPSNRSRIMVGYPNGAVLSMTGRCTGNIDLGQIAGQPDWRQRQAVRYEWCETWLDPTGSGEFQPGWVYGRYIRPR